jgi:hypothetical protein
MSPIGRRARRRPEDTPLPLRVVTFAPLAALALAALAAPAAPAACRGEVTGSISARFGCLAEVVTSPDGKPVFVITPTDAIADVPVYKPGAFQLPAPPKAGRYTLDELGMGMASLAAEGGTLFTATKTSSRRGEVTLTLRTVKRDPARPGAYVVHGSYHARLVPAGGGKQGEVVFEVTF